MTPPAELTIGTAIRSSHKRLRTVANGCERLRTWTQRRANTPSTPRPPDWNGNPCYTFGKNQKFLANLWSIPHKKCGMSLQQILSMVQRCLKRWWYYFSNVYHQLMQPCFPCNKYSNSATNVFCQCKHFWAKTSVNTAGKTLEKCICGICNGPVKTTCVFVLDGRVTAPYPHVFRD